MSGELGDATMIIRNIHLDSLDETARRALECRRHFGLIEALARDERCVLVLAMEALDDGVADPAEVVSGAVAVPGREDPICFHARRDEATQLLIELARLLAQHRRRVEGQLRDDFGIDVHEPVGRASRPPAPPPAPEASAPRGPLDGGAG